MDLIIMDRPATNVMNRLLFEKWKGTRWIGLKIKAQFGMVMNLDKCIGCHTCSVTCSNTWTDRPGAEYMYGNNVETKPGVDYHRGWEDNNERNGWWHVKNGKLKEKCAGEWNELI